MLERSKILIVDDSEINRSILEGILEPLDVDVFEASSGFDAMALSLQHDFAVILMDVIMPNFDGYETTQRIVAASRFKSIPIILVTAISNKNQYLKAYESGAVDYIEKPVEPLVVYNKVKLFVELHHQRLVAERASHTKSLFFSTMTHELRTPLNAIIGFTKRLMNRLDGQISSKDMNALKVVLDSSNQQLKLVGDLLDASALEAGKLKINMATVSIEEIIDAAFDQTRVLAEQKGLILSWEGCETELWATLDFPRALQIVTNLISNAIKYTLEGGIHISVQAQEERVAIGVEDTGIGMREESISELFRLFGRLEESQELGQEGTGLGLYLSAKLAALQGGVIDVESEYGVGSRFTLRVPLKRL